MFKLFTARGEYVYHDVINDLVDGYNNSWHRSIGMAPNEVNKKTRSRVFQRLYGCRDIIEYYSKLQREKMSPKLNVDDDVRIRHPESTAFMKMYYPRWRDRIFKVKKVITSGKQPLYKLDGDVAPSVDKRRGLYQQELQKVIPGTYRIDKILKRDRANNKVFVSWVDYPSSFNSWITEEDNRVQDLVKKR